MANGAETPWLKAMLEATYSDECPQHSKSWTNHFCLDCEESDPFCSECSGPHTGHRYITVVKSNYRVAVSVSAIGEYLNVSKVKTYTTNGEKVVCLNKRPPTDPKSGKKLPECSCKSSTLVLRSSFEFCSIACKLNGIERGCEGLTFLPARKRNVSKVNSGSAVQSKPRKGKGKRKVVNVPKRNVSKVNSGSAVQSTPRKGKVKVVNVPNESGSGSRGPPPENPPEPNPMLRRSRRKGVACRGPLS